MSPPPNKKPSNIGIKKKPPEKGKPDDNKDDDLEQYAKKVLLKPKDQLDLTDIELKEIIPRTLSSINPQIPVNEIQWSYVENTFVSPPHPGHSVVLFEQQGGLLRKDSEEARQQMMELGLDPAELLADIEDEEVEEEEEEAADEEKPSDEGDDAVSKTATEGPEEEEEEKPPEPEKQEEEPEEHEEAEVPVKKMPSKKKFGKPKKLINQFNFCERDTLTYSLPTRSQETQTIPPSMCSYRAHMKAWLIYDTYQDDYDTAQIIIKREKREKMGLPPKPIFVKTAAQIQKEMHSRMFISARILERMINQNTYFEIAKDYRYWNDPADDFRKEEGTVLPLWKFTYDKTKKHSITDLDWNPHYYDLFAVCFGYFEYSKPMSEGALCLFTLKNPSFPDYICMTESAVMCCDTHTKYPYMIAIGLYDGSVLVYNVQETCKEPIYRSNNVTNKHRGIVWEVKWADDLPDGELNFYSVGGDGKVNNWVLMANDLAVTTVIILYLDQPPVPGPDGTMLKVRACATCLKLHPVHPKVYYVGTEEGLILKCSTLYSSMYLMTYKAHQMPVYRIDFNKFNTDIFISCSADWRIKIWEDGREDPLFVFDIGDRVGDVKWAPYSSTVFGCVTLEGRLCIYDLNVNKYKPICTQAIVSKKKNKVTRLAFNYNLPIVIVGDDKGCTTCVKLSPNLRVPCKAPKKTQGLDQNTLQLMKLDKLLSLVREPATLTIPEDTAGVEEE